MARFTFAAGNARALTRAPLYLAGLVASRLVRRDDRLWVFGSGIGPGEGALALYRAAAEHGGRRLVWLATTDAEIERARSLGLRAVRKDGWRGFRLTLRARVVAVTHGFGDVNRYAVPGAFVVQLWHGIPLKRLHLDSPAALRLRPLPDHPLVRRFLSVLYRRAGRQIALFPAASELAAARLRSAFGLPDDVVAVTGDPRDDVLSHGSATERATAARALLTSAVGPLPATVVLFAPTWRDGAPDPGLPTAAEWAAIGAWLERADAVLLVRPHPLSVGDYAAGAAGSNRIRMLGSDVLPDVMPVLSGVDVLLTDYSSIAYDYSLTGGPIVFFAPDLGRYEASRGLYESYRDFSGGTQVGDWASVLRMLDGAESDERLLAHSRRVRSEHFDLDDGAATSRVLEEILRRTGGGASSTEHPLRDRTVIESVEVTDADTLVLAGRGAVALARLAGQRLTLPGEVHDESGRWTARIPLTASPWGGPALAPPSGAYRLVLGDGATGTSRVVVDASVPPTVVTRRLRLELSTDGGALVATFSPPLTDGERAGQRALEREYRTRGVGAEASVFFESFYSQVVACNPRAIDARLAIERPDVVRYWSVVDGSVVVPEGAVPVVEGTAAWWRARAEARVLVVNDWLRKRHRPRPGQIVLQTWHGTMLKRLALDRPHVGARTRLAVLRERARWDVLLAQNPHSATTFRSAYRFTGEIWQEGYPRDDVLVTGDGFDIRRRLGIGPERRIVLYAPTWRDDRAEIVDFLDLPALAASLGDDTVVLVRGHSRTLRHGRDLVGDRVLDVTTYPDVSDLLMVADVLVTDYSSLMFDFSATGRPIVFFTPDLAHYGDELRGFYFDLLADAPGPVTSTQEQLVVALGAAVDDADAYRARYEAWRARYNPRDDGHAAERVVRRLLDTGLLDT